MIEYIDYLVVNNESYRRNLAFGFLFLFILGFILVVSVFNSTEYMSVSGNIDSVSMGYCKRKKTAPFNNSNGYYKVESIVIRINNENYYVDHNLDHKWKVVLNNVHEEDSLELKYNFIDGYKIIGALTKNEIEYISLNERNDPILKFKVGLAIGFVLLSSFLCFFISRRKKIAKSII